LRLDPTLRFWNYAAFATLFASGALWLVADSLKDGDSGELWQVVAANTLMLHGVTAMVALVLLGALIPLHVQRSWRAGKNRFTGTVMVVINALLIATASGLYYAGSDVLRAVVADLHIVAGLALPALVVTHIVLGRRAKAGAGAVRPRRVEIPGGLRPVTSSEDP
jgi:hypothetical protein